MNVATCFKELYKFFFNLTDMIMVTRSPWIGVGPGFNSQGSITFLSGSLSKLSFSGSDLPPYASNTCSGANDQHGSEVSRCNHVLGEKLDLIAGQWS